MQTVCIYCGSSDKIEQKFLDAAYEMGKIIANRGFTMTFGGGKTGLMGMAANGCLDAGGEVIGVITEQFNTNQLAHAQLTHMEITSSMHARKARLVEISDAFVILPGGYGTFDEFFEIVTWAQIGIHRKPIGLLNIDGYYDPLLQMVQKASYHGFIYPGHDTLFVSDPTPAKILPALEQYKSPKDLERWVERAD